MNGRAADMSGVNARFLGTVALAANEDLDVRGPAATKAKLGIGDMARIGGEGRIRIVRSCSRS